MKAVKSVSQLFVINIIVLIVTLIIALAGLEDKFLPIDWQQSVFWWLVQCAVAAVIIAAGIYLFEVVKEYQEERGAHESDKIEAAARQALPKQIRVTERTDRLVIDAEGNGILEWNFVVTGIDHSTTPHLELQVYSDHENAKNITDFKRLSSNVEILELVVGGRPITPPSQAYIFKEIRLPLHATGLIEFGILKIPTDLGGKARVQQIDIKARMKLHKTFLHASSEEFFIVEVPQLTESLTVTIESGVEGRNIVLSPAKWDSKIEALTGYAGTNDSKETIEQAQNVRETYGKLVWNAKYPKLGYRYVLGFRMTNT